MFWFIMIYIYTCINIYCSIWHGVYNFMQDVWVMNIAMSHSAHAMLLHSVQCSFEDSTESTFVLFLLCFLFSPKHMCNLFKLAV